MTDEKNVLSDKQLEKIAGGITSARLKELAIPLFKKGLTSFDVYTELTENGLIDEDEIIEDSDLHLNEYLNDMQDKYMVR